jgi:hypothetical protein
MKYMLLIYGNNEAWDGMTEERYSAIMDAHYALEAELTASGEMVENEELRGEGTRIVRAPGGTVTVTDGPFVELKEIVAGYYIVDCASIERATEIAGRMVEAEFALVEVRPIGR